MVNLLNEINPADWWKQLSALSFHFYNTVTLRRTEILRTGNAAQVPQVNRLLESLHEEHKLTLKKKTKIILFKKKNWLHAQKRKNLEKEKNK